MDFQIIEVKDALTIQRIREFWAQVWTEMGHHSRSDIERVLLDEDGENARHWIVQFEGEMIAAARLSSCSSIWEAPESDVLVPFEPFIPTPFGRLSRLVVRSDFRERGIAKQLQWLRMQEAYKSGAKAVIASAVPWCVASLTKLGFIDLGELPINLVNLDSPWSLHVMVHRLETTASSGQYLGDHDLASELSLIPKRPFLAQHLKNLQTAGRT